MGSANGRSMRVSSSVRPGSLSRTSTHAIAVPITMLIAATSSDETMVSFRVDAASGVVIAWKKPLSPSDCERHTTAANGISTMMLR